MGVSASSLLDDTKSAYIKGEAEAELKQFGPYYRRQFSMARFCQVEDELEQNKEKMTQLLRQKEAPQEAEVLYEEGVLYFDDTRKWRERYVVVRANYCLECHESLESFLKGVPPRHKLLPTGGAVLTTEERYIAMVDRCFPDDTSVKEEFAPPLSGMPGQFPVYLRLPYRRDSYFCFRQQAKQEDFLSILNDCIRHQNQDFLKRKTCEVQAFLKAIQLYRQDKGRYEAWDMLIGSDVRVMANVVMEQLLPSLEKDMLPRLKAKKTEKKRVWFATVEAAYILVQEHLLEGLSALKEDCRASVRQQEVLIHSDMDQILESRRRLEEKVRAQVSEPAEKLCSESVQPYLGSVLEELMEPISSGFQEGRQLSEATMDQVCQDFLGGGDKEKLKKALAFMGRPNLLSCFQRISSLQEKLQHLHDRFGFSNITGVIHSAQIDLQLLMENAAFTFEQLLHKAIQDNPDNASSAVEKVKHRVLKQYDYDSSTVRKRISQDALVSITLPFIKRNLAPTCKTGLQSLEQSIDSEHSNFLHVENVYESVLLQILDKEVTKVVKEAVSLKKYNLFTDSRDLVSKSSRSSLSSPPVSTPGSPAMALASPAKASSEPQPPSALVGNGVSPSPQKGEEQVKEDGERPVKAAVDVTMIETPLGKVEQKESELSAIVQEVEPPAPTAEEVVQAVGAEADVDHETATVAEITAVNETQEVNVAAAAPENASQEEVSVQTEKVQTQSSEALKEAVEEALSVVDTLKTDAEEAAAQTEAPEPGPAPSAEETRSQAATSSEGDREGESSEVKLEAPSSGEAPVALQLEGHTAEPAPVSDPNSLDASVGSESPPSDVESTEEVKVTQSSEDDVSKSPVSSDDAPEDKSASEEASLQREGDTSCDVSVGGDIEAGASVNAEASTSPSSEETPSSPEARPPDCVKDIRDLVVEVIEVEELMQRYPSGVPKDE